MKLLIVIITLVLLGARIGSAGPPLELDGTVNRVNYGVIYHYSGVVRPMTSLIRHTFKLALPRKRDSVDFEFMRDVDEMVQGKMPCIRELEQGKTDIHAVCQKILRNMKFLKKVSSDGSKQMHTLVEDIYSLVPINTRRAQKQNKRAILGFVADLQNSIFGVAKQDDIDILNTNLLKLTETVNHDLGILKVTVTDLHKFAQETTDRLNAVVDEVKQNAIANLKLIETIVYNENKLIDFLNNITLNTMELKHNIDSLVVHYTNYLTAFQILVGGRLPMYLVPQQVLYLRTR
jgi:hypothetical protein